MKKKDILIEPGTLRPAIEKRKILATRSGALETIRTEQDFVEQQGVKFMVRWVSSLGRKAAEQTGVPSKGSGKDPARNPFLPPNPELTVAELSRSHLAVLNKFNVIDGHLLMVTREFEHQETLLTPDDFLAFWICLAEIDGLGFYNGGTLAGASQEHKHLQMVPLPLYSPGPRMPMDPHFGSLKATGTIARIPSLPWRHRCVRLESRLALDPRSAAQETHQLYRAMLGELEIEAVRADAGVRQSRPYNLLIARDFMALVPRTRERAAGISINALGFAGSLFVGERRKMQVVRDTGPMNLLRRVAFPESAED